MQRDPIPFERTRPIPTVPLPALLDASESAFDAYTTLIRMLETTPPHVPRFPISTWAVTRWGVLYQLRCYRLDDPRLIFPEGDPYGRIRTWPRQRLVIDKYVQWLQQGSEPPPLEAWETHRGNLKICEGHHRAQALVEAGRHTCLIWVAPLFSPSS